MAKTMWTFKMDFRADPETEFEIKNDLVETIREYPFARLDGNDVVVVDAKTALVVKLRYFNNIVSVA